MAYLPQCTVVVFPVTSVSVFKFTVSIFILKYMHAYFQIVFIAAVYCLFFFVPMYMHICTFRIRRYLLLARAWYLMSYASPTRHKLSSLFFAAIE